MSEGFWLQKDRLNNYRTNEHWLSVIVEMLLKICGTVTAIVSSEILKHTKLIQIIENLLKR